MPRPETVSLALLVIAGIEMTSHAESRTAGSQNAGSQNADSRRDFLKTSGLVAGGYWLGTATTAKAASPNEKLNVACIGVGGRGSANVGGVSGEDIVALRRFVGLSQVGFSSALGISVHTLRNWEQGRRTPEGPALALLRIAARHPAIVREAASPAA